MRDAYRGSVQRAPTHGWPRVQVWIVDLDVADGERVAHASVLSTVEAERSARFRSAVHRNRFKALGEGLGFGLDRFEVALQPGADARFLSFADPWTDPKDWSLVDINLGARYAAALAIECATVTVSYHPWHRPAASTCACAT